MPFGKTPSRNQSDLTEFFRTNLKARVERDRTLHHRYIVHRSDDDFNITETIIRDIYEADIVLCDLSGHSANPNVMYELGLRLAITNKPVILFREYSEKNARIFDINGFHVFEYSPTRYRELEDHIVQKIKKFESGVEIYQSPVLRVLKEVPSLVSQLRRDRMMGVLKMMRINLFQSHVAISTSIGGYLRDKHAITCEGSPIKEIVTNPEYYSTLDWSELSLRPMSPTALHAFLAEPLLDGLLPEADVTEIVRFVAEYDANYFADQGIWNRPPFNLILAFVTECADLNVAIDCLIDYFERPAEHFHYYDIAMTIFSNKLCSLAVAEGVASELKWFRSTLASHQPKDNSA